MLQQAETAASAVCMRAWVPYAVLPQPEQQEARLLQTLNIHEECWGSVMGTYWHVTGRDAVNACW